MALYDDPAEKPYRDELAAVIQRCRQNRDKHKPYLDDIMSFCLPHRMPINGTEPSRGWSSIYDGLGMQMIGDFASDMGLVFTPKTQAWVEIQPTDPVLRANTGVQGQIADFTDALFQRIAASNFYEAVEEAYQDLALGTMGLIVDDPGRGEPMRCIPVQTSDLLIDTAIDGRVAARFYERKIRANEVIWGFRLRREELPPQLQRDITGNRQPEVTVLDGVWPRITWSEDQGVPEMEWHYVLQINGDLIRRERIRDAEAGGMGFIVARWRPDWTTGMGYGPAYPAAPDLYTLDTLVELFLRRTNYDADPIVRIDDDGVADLREGFLPGSVIKAAVGSTVEPLQFGSPSQIGFVTKDDLETRVRRAFFQDEPMQVGATPPTATQWLDMARRKARRIGAPASRVVNELVLPTIRRFAYLLAQRGDLPGIRWNEGVVTVEAQSPLIKAAREDEALINQRFVTDLMTMNPQMAQLAIDWNDYFAKQRQNYGAGVKLLSPEDQAARMQQMAAMAETMMGVDSGAGQAAAQ